MEDLFDESQTASLFVEGRHGLAPRTELPYPGDIIRARLSPGSILFGFFYGVRRGVAALGFSFWDFVAAAEAAGGHGRMEMAEAETQSGNGSPHSKTSNRVEIVGLSAALECGEASPLWVFLFGISSPRRRGRGGGAATAGWKWPKPKPKAAMARRTTWHQWIKNAGFESRNPKRRWLAALQKPQRTSRLILPIWYTTYHVNLNRGTGRGRGH